MKKILLSIALLVSVNAFSLVDSNKIKTSISLQVRDWLFLNSYLQNSEEMENVYDSMKIKLRTFVNPGLTTVVKVDSIKQGQIIRLAQIIKDANYGVVAIPYGRINSALKANTYLTTKIDAIDTYYQTIYISRLQTELDRLKQSLQ